MFNKAKQHQKATEFVRITSCSVCVKEILMGLSLSLTSILVPLLIVSPLMWDLLDSDTKKGGNSPTIFVINLGEYDTMKKDTCTIPKLHEGGH